MKNVGYALRALAGGLTAILMTTCAHAQASVTISEAKAAILAARASAWKDPGSIQDAQISPPESCIGGANAHPFGPAYLRLHHDERPQFVRGLYRPKGQRLPVQR
jgi:hypothetical protein